MCFVELDDGICIKAVTNNKKYINCNYHNKLALWQHNGGVHGIAGPNAADGAAAITSHICWGGRWDTDYNDHKQCKYNSHPSNNCSCVHGNDGPNATDDVVAI